MLLEVALKRILVLGMLSFSLFAARDPVGWSLDPATGFAATPVGGISSVTYTLTNNLPFAATIVTDHISKGGTFTIADHCRGVSLATNASCIVHISFHATHTGVSTFQFIYGYHNNRIPLPKLSISGVATTTDVVGYFSDFPTLISITPAQSPSFTVTYVNESTAAVTGFAGNASDTNILQISPALASIAFSGNTCGLGSSPGTLSAPGSCHLTGTISSATTVGTATVTGLYTYNTTQTVTPTAQTRIIQSTSACPLASTVTIPLPTTTLPYTDNVVKFTFTNQCTSQTVSLGPVTVATITGSLPATITTNSASTTYDTCSNATLAGQASCFVLASVVPNTSATGSLGVMATVYNGTNYYHAQTSSTIDPLFSGHEVFFQNECPFDVWYGIENGAGYNPSTGAGTSPDPTPNAGGANNDANYFLAAAVPGQAQSPTTNGGMRFLAVSSYYNGSIWGRTNCAYASGQFVCQTGMCSTITTTTGSGSATCILSNSSSGAVTPNNPWTKAEFTISSTMGTDGVYDVSLINGFNVPIEIKALGPPTSSNPQTCTAPGALLQKNTQLGGASWNLDPTVSPSLLSRPDFILVTPGADSGCANDSACAATEGCGMAFSALNSSTFNNGTPINRRCGNFLGYSDLQNYAGFSSAAQWGNASYNMYSKYNLGTTLTSIGYTTYGTFGGNAATFGNMVSCQTTSNNSLNTCYPNPGVYTPSTWNFANCCGCVDWAAAGISYNGGYTCPITIPGYPTPSVNTAWTQTSTVLTSAMNAIYWIKIACPTCYSFPFDDPSSSFTCTQNNGTAIYTNYQVTFCPGGLTGRPASVAEGRCVGATNCPT